jgi:hypothetical protein
MGTKQLSKSEILAAAQAVLTQDDHEQAGSARLLRLNNVFTVLSVVFAIFICMTPLIASRCSKIFAMSQPPAKCITTQNQ